MSAATPLIRVRRYAEPSRLSPLASWIAGLMRENYDAVGFLPYESLEGQYLRHGRYVLQNDERGRRLGYLLHGALRRGRAVNVAQHVIDYDRRRHGYGEAALRTLIERAERVGASSVTARVGADLTEALAFWCSQGFLERGRVPGGQDHPVIMRLVRPLALPLLSALCDQEYRRGSEEKP